MSIFCCFRAFVSESRNWSNDILAQKPFNIKWPFKVIRGHLFWLTRNYLLLCNTIGLISKASENKSTESAEESPFSSNHCRLMRLLQRNPQLFAHSLYSKKLDSLLYIFTAGSVDRSLIFFTQSFLKVSLRGWPYFHENIILCKMAIEGHSRSRALGSVESLQLVLLYYSVHL